MPNKKLFYVECETNPSETESTVTAFLISAESQEIAAGKAHRRSQHVTHIQFIGNIDADVFKEIGELAT